MRTTLISIMIFAFIVNGWAQVDQKVFAEHFTNTKCSICASRNPGLITNFTKNPDVVHISFHPSSPYSSCVLNLHNTSENDDRTKFYNIYGSTPQLVLNGNIYSGSFNPSTIFDPYKGKSSSIELISSIQSKGSDSLIVEVKVNTISSHSFGTERIGIFLVEDTIFYDAPNGEKQHYNVFRRSLTDVKGDNITLSMTPGVGDTISFRVADHKDWDIQRMRVVAIIQKASDKSLIQASISSAVKDNFVSKIDERTISKTSSIKIYPNPSSGTLQITGSAEKNINFSIFDLMGKTIMTGESNEDITLDISRFQSGYYNVVVFENDNVIHQRILKK